MQREAGPAGVAQKLKFQIATASGEDPDYPARELLLHTTHGMFSMDSICLRCHARLSGGSTRARTCHIRTMKVLLC